MAINNKKITYWGTGEERREYIHVNDAIQGCLNVLNKNYENRTVMCSGMQSTKISDMLIMIKEIMLMMLMIIKEIMMMIIKEIMMIIK